MVDLELFHPAQCSNWLGLKDPRASTDQLASALAVILGAVCVRRGSHGEIVQGIARAVLARAVLAGVLMVGKILHGEDEILSSL